MTKFIDKSSQVKSTKTTVFIKCLVCDLSTKYVDLNPNAFDFVEFIGHDEAYGDVFKCWCNDTEGNFGLYFGTKGEEQYVNE